MTMIPPVDIPAIPPRSSRSAMRFSFQRSDARQRDHSNAGGCS
jgi:hypothetical protein